MNRLDCGNQRTGHPRCAQLMAKTWKVLSSTFRTQHAMSAVSPSQELTTGLRYVASRVWPAGNCSNLPSESHDSYPNFFSRVTGENKKRTMGTANTAPTMALKRIPSFTSIMRLDIPFSSLIEGLPCLRPSKRSGTADPGILSGGWKAMPRHRRFLLPTWAGPRHHRAKIGRAHV